MARTILITGSGRLGIRRFAAQVAELQGTRVLHLRTNGPLADAAERDSNVSPDSWYRRTAPRNLLAAVSAEPRNTTVLIDSITVWAANRLLELGDPDMDGWNDAVQALDTQLIDEITRILRWARHGRRGLVLVMNEVVGEYQPTHPLGYAYQSVVDHLAQTISEAVDGIYTIVAGAPYEVKRDARTRVL